MAEPPSFLLTRCHVWLQVPPGAGDVAQRVEWPERQLRWCAAAKPARAASSAASASPPPGELLSCSLQLLCQPCGDAAGVAELLGRLHRAGVVAKLVHTAPWPLPLQAATLDELRVQGGRHADPVTAVLPLLHRTGCAIFPAGADDSSDAVPPTLAALVGRRFAAVTEALRDAQLRPFIDGFAYSDAASRSTGRMEVRLPLAASPACVDPDACALARFVNNAPWVRAVRAALRDPTPEVSASLIMSAPGATDQAWHADGPHLSVLRPLEAWEALHAGDGRPGSPPHGLCLFLPLIDVTPQRGCTQMWLGSHAWGGLVEEAPRALGPDAMGPLARWGAVLWPTVPAGTGILYDYRLVHRGAANTEAERPVVQLVYRTAGATGGQGNKWWDESANFGEAPLMSALPPHTDWSVPLQAAEDQGDAARGAAWWASQGAETTQQAPQELPAASSGWGLFD
jgi:hypothetical protein